MNFGTRIKQLRKQQRLTQKELADRVGVSSQSVSQWENGIIKNIGGQLLSLVAKELQTSSEYILSGAESSQMPSNTVAWHSQQELPAEDYLFVPKFNFGNSLEGVMRFTLRKNEKPQAFRREWVEREGLSEADLLCVYADDDSMSPVISSGNLLLIDRSQTRVIDGKIYAIRYGQELRIKRLFLRPDGTLLIHSDNVDRYPPIATTDSDMQHIEVLGRAVWTAGNL